MKVINPFGKSARDNHDIQPFACMCTSKEEHPNFSGARTTADTCSHCGCRCDDTGTIDPKGSNGNYQIANTTFRVSYL